MSGERQQHTVVRQCYHLICDKRCLMAFAFVTVAILVALVVVGVTSLATSTNMEGPSRNLKLVIDSDAGTDDAMALMLFLEAQKRNNTNLQIVAITTVVGNTDVHHVTNNVLRILTMEKRLDIPVYKGAAKCIKTTEEMDNFFGVDGLGDVPWTPPQPAPVATPGHAAVKLVELVNEHPNELTIVALGPLTNIGLAIRLDENFLLKLKHLYILGGATEGHGNKKPGVEFNFFMDPEANYIILKDTDFRQDSVSILSWEQIVKMHITHQWRKDVLGALQSERIQFLNKAERNDLTMSKPEKLWNFADVVLAAVVLFPDLAARVDSHAIVPVTEGETRGGIVVDYLDQLEDARPIRLLSGVDVERYKSILLDYFS